MFVDFLKAEWKTLLIVSLLLGGAFLFLITETTEVRRRTPIADPTLVMGSSWEPLELGMSREAVVAALGPPDAESEEAFEVSTLTYSERGWRVHLFEERVTALVRPWAQAQEALIPSGDRLSAWPEKKTGFGSEVARINLESESRRFVRYRAGIAVVERELPPEPGSDELRWEPVEVWVLPPG